MFTQKIEEAKLRRIDALAKADVEAFVDGYDEDGAILVVKGKKIQGREQLLEQMENFITLLGPMQHTLESEAYWQEEGGLVTEKGQFSYSYADDAGPFYTGTYLYLWKLQPSGEYLLLRELHIDD